MIHSNYDAGRPLQLRRWRLNHIASHGGAVVQQPAALHEDKPQQQLKHRNEEMCDTAKSKCSGKAVPYCKMQWHAARNDFTLCGVAGFNEKKKLCNEAGIPRKTARLITFKSKRSHANSDQSLKQLRPGDCNTVAVACCGCGKGRPRSSRASEKASILRTSYTDRHVVYLGK